MAATLAIRGQMQTKSSILGLLTNPCFNSISYSSCSINFQNIFCLEIIIFQPDIFIQTPKTAEAIFTCPLGHLTSIIFHFTKTKIR